MADGCLHDKVIVIVGGTTGMGLSAAKACAAAGARVLAVGPAGAEAEEAGKTLKDSGRVFVADARDAQMIERAMQYAVDYLHGLDGVYHVAGGSGRKAGDGPLHEMSDDGWDFVVKLNLTSMIYSNRAAVRQFLKRGKGGTVLNMGSVLPISPSPKFFATHGYAAVKSAVIGLTRSCAAYYAKDNIRFNAILPGLVATPMSQRASGDEAIMRFIRTKQPLDGGRIGQSEDLDAAVVYFLSGGSKFATGQVLMVDGGWSVTEGQYVGDAEIS